MEDREPTKTLYSVQVEFRTASSFLIAYSVNVSRGCAFLETDTEIPQGARMAVRFKVPNGGTTSLGGVVAWRRSLEEATSGPPGLGVEFEDITPELGAVVDHLVANFSGVRVLLASSNRQDRTTIARHIKSIFSTAEITQAADPNVAASILTADFEVAIVDLDVDIEGGLNVIRQAKALRPPVPTIAMTTNATYRERAVSAGTDELMPNPPAFGDLQVILVRALSKPSAVRRLEDAHANASGSFDVLV